MIWIGLWATLSVMTVLCGTATAAIRSASHTRLVEAFRRRAREGALPRYEKNERQYEMCAAICTMGLAAGFVGCAAYRLDESAEPARIAEVGVGVALWLLSFAVSVPVAWARYAGERFLARVFPALEAARIATYPLVRACQGIDEVVRRLAGAAPESPDGAERMELDILDAVSEAETAGAVDETERAMIRSVMRLDETTVGEIMTPRTDMIGIEIESNFDQVMEHVREAAHSRIPVFEDTMDRILGVVYAKDLIAVRTPRSFTLRSIMRSVPFIPETRDVYSLLREFQANHIHIAIVLDEYGGTSGLVTIEDILEELVGEISDEHDESPPAAIRRIDEQTVEVDARLRIAEVNEEMELALPEDEAYDTVGGFVLSRLGRIPTRGEILAEPSVRIEVLEANERKIARLRLRRLVPTEAE